MPNPVSVVLRALASRNGVMLSACALILGGLFVSVSSKPGIEALAAAPTAAPAAVSSAPALSPAQATGGFSAEQKKQIEAIIKDYLLANPEVMIEVQSALEAKMEKLQAERLQSALKENSAEIFRAASAPVAGNPKGDVTIVEFFDYNCGYCKKAFSDLAAVVAADKNVKIVLKEFPILSKGSEEAARVALAAGMQNKYWEFHRGMLESQGQANEASALRVAERLGLNMAKLRTDMVSPEVRKEIDRARALAQKMGIQGTPHFLVGDKVVPGAPDGLKDILAQHVAEIRKSGGCKVC